MSDLFKNHVGFLTRRLRELRVGTVVACQTGAKLLGSKPKTTVLCPFGKILLSHSEKKKIELGVLKATIQRNKQNIVFEFQIVNY